MRGAFALIAIALSLSGCAALDGPAAPSDPSSGGATPLAGASTGDALVFALPENAVHAPLATALSISTQWAKPLEAIAAHADARASGFTWYVGLRGARVRVTYVDDLPYLTDADTSDSRINGGDHVRFGAIAPHARVDTGILRPGDAPLPVDFPVEGRFVLSSRDASAARSGTLNVTVTRAEAAGEQAFVALRGDAGALRFEPNEVSIPPGSRVTFLNEASGPAGARLVETLVPIETTGADARLAPVDEGTYDLVVVAHDGASGRGAAALPFVADFERPATRATFPSYDGSFACSEPACGGEDVHAVPAEYSVVDAILNVTTSSPLPAGVAVTIEQDGHVVGEAVADGQALVHARKLHAGDITLRFRPAAGALVAYHATLELDYRLPPPPQLRT